VKIIVGLGNPGPKYAGTRHNLGFSVLEALAEKCRVKASSVAYGALVGKGRAAGEGILLARPQTYMNRSGESVAAILRATGEGPEELVVVHDDLDLPLGRIRIKKSGGDGGHNGVASVISELGTSEFVRVRLGIGRPQDGGDPVEFVLSTFSPEELETVRDTVSRAVEAVLAIMHEGTGKAMNRFNADTKA